MLKKTIFIGVLVLSILCFFTLIHAAQYYDQYPGIGFVPENKDNSYYKYYGYSYLYHNDASDAHYLCPVTFNVPDGSVYFIKSMGIRFRDNLSDGGLIIELRKENLYTGAIHTVASWASPGSSDSIQTASQGTIAGKKLVDTKKFAYWLFVRFYRTGAVNPSSDLVLYQVRIHYGT